MSKFSYRLRRLQHKLYSNTWQTVLVVTFIVFASVMVTLWFFWRSLYLPELKNHASYLVSEMRLIADARTHWQDNPKMQDWVNDHTHIRVITNPAEFPDIAQKPFVEFFTDELATEVGRELGREVIVYFKFKPTPKLWLQDSRHTDIWLQEPVTHYSQYSPALLILFLVGLPILTLLVIFVLVRALNRPLKKLERAASDYIELGHATSLPTTTGPSEIRKVNTAFNRLFTTLNQAQKERTIMLAGISHDLRTPLTRMRLTAEMLGDEFFKEGLIYDIEDMDAILEQFISFMKDGSDEAVRLVSLDGICREIMVQFSDTAFHYHNSISTLVPIRPLSIKRLIVNLVNNAIRYGRPPIHIEIDMIDKDGLPNLQLCVSDEGDGVVEDQLERIMQPFERGETARTTQGSGLGLAIVARIAKLHQGKIIIDNGTNNDSQKTGLKVTVIIPMPSLTTENDDND